MDIKNLELTEEDFQMLFDGFWSALDIELDSDEHLVDLGNQTFNHTPIWWHSMGQNHFRKFKGRKAKELILPLKLGLARIQCDPEYYFKLEPKNGFGSLLHAFEYMYSVLQACQQYPEAYYYFNG